MGTHKLDPRDSRPVLHFNDQAVLVASNVEHHPVFAADAGIAVLIFDALRRLPVCPYRVKVPVFAAALLNRRILVDAKT